MRLLKLLLRRRLFRTYPVQLYNADKSKRNGFVRIFRFCKVFVPCHHTVAESRVAEIFVVLPTLSVWRSPNVPVDGMVSGPPLSPLSEEIPHKGGGFVCHDSAGYGSFGVYGFG